MGKHEKNMNIGQNILWSRDAALTVSTANATNIINRIQYNK